MESGELPSLMKSLTVTEWMKTVLVIIALALSGFCQLRAEQLQDHQAPAERQEHPSSAPPIAAEPSLVSPVHGNPIPATNLCDLLERIDLATIPPLNRLVLDVIEAMPSGGGYASNDKALVALKRSITLTADGHLGIEPELAKPTFCSGATYLVFLSVLEKLDAEGRLVIDPKIKTSLLMKLQPDGVGVWGRWNANGPGTARLFHELQLGDNFVDFAHAKAGDFLKMWWTPEVGAKERGHSVVFLAAWSSPGAGELVSFWSANNPGGYSVKTIAASKIKRALFSRLRSPAKINDIASLPARDDYLAEMLKRGSAEDELCAMTGLPYRSQKGPDQAKVTETGNIKHDQTLAVTNVPRHLATDVQQPIEHRAVEPHKTESPSGAPIPPRTASAKPSVINPVRETTDTAPSSRISSTADAKKKAPEQKKKSFLRRLFGGGS